MGPNDYIHATFKPKGGDFDPEFDVKLQGHAIAKFLGPNDPATIAKLYEFFRREKWRGQLVVNFPGNGGVNDIVFTEVRRMTEVENGK